VSKRREALSAKANTGKFTGLRAETPARRSSAKTAKYSGKDFVYGVLFVTLLAFGAKTPVNCTAKWFCCCTSDCEYFLLISLAQSLRCLTLERIGSDSNLGLRVTGRLTFGPKPGAIDKG